MSHTHRKLLPIGSKMTDAAYPFRGEHCVQDAINHGHTGVRKKPSTSISMRISGTNLVIEQVYTTKGVDLECELGVDGGVGRPVVLQPISALTVPGDGHDYNLTAALRPYGSSLKHYCRLTLNGSEGGSVAMLRLRAPKGPAADSTYILVDGQKLWPTDGWFRIPCNSKECALMFRPAATPSRSSKSPPSAPLLTSPADTQFLLETVRGAPTGPGGAPSQPTLLCTATGAALPLTPGSSVPVLVSGGPFRLLLPDEAYSTTKNRTAASPSSAPLPVPEVETRVLAAPPAGPADVGRVPVPSFVATAPNFQVELAGEDGSRITGFGVASLPLPHRRPQAVQITIRDTQGNVVARQKSHVPTLQAPAALLQLQDEPNGQVRVSAKPGASLSVAGVPQADPVTGAVLPRVMPQQVVVEQPNPDGTVSTLALEVGTKTWTAGAPAPVPVTAPSSPNNTSTASAGPERWVTDLCNALQKPNTEEQQRLVQAIQPSTLPAMSIVNFVREQMIRQPPAISFTVSKSGLESVQCPGCTVTVTVGKDPPRSIPTYGSVQMAAGRPAMLTAISTANQRPVSACRVLVAAMGEAAAPVTPPRPSPVTASASSPDGKADSDLVTMLLDTLIQHTASPAQVANALAAAPTGAFSTQGKRTLPLLVTCLRNQLGSALSTPMTTTPREAVQTEYISASATGQNSGSTPFLNLTVQPLGAEVHGRLVCAPHHRLVCDVDGVGGSTGMSEFSTKMSAGRPHRLNLGLVDAYGKLVFQQKLELPAMTSTSWGVSVQHNGLAIDPDQGNIATASIDRALERAPQGNFVAFDASEPHFIVLRKYASGTHGEASGELALRLPGMALPPELAELAAILRRRTSGELNDAAAQAELHQLRTKWLSPAVTELIKLILDLWSRPGNSSTNAESSSNRVFFRLTGSD